MVIVEEVQRRNAVPKYVKYNIEHSEIKIILFFNRILHTRSKKPNDYEGVSGISHQEDRIIF